MTLTATLKCHVAHRSIHNTVEAKCVDVWAQKHVDFVVYDRYTAAIIAVVELDDRSHDAKERRDRDAFVDHVLGGLGVAIIRVRAASRYNVEALRFQLAV